MNIIEFICVLFVAAFLTNAIMAYEEPDVEPPVIDSMPDLYMFLYTDTTDSGTYILDEHDCYHFTIELADNASLFNISLGAALLGQNEQIQGDAQHSVAFFWLGDDKNLTNLRFIEGQNDNIYTPSMIADAGYKCVVLYNDPHDMPEVWFKYIPSRPLSDYMEK